MASQGYYNQGPQYPQQRYAGPLCDDGAQGDELATKAVAPCRWIDEMGRGVKEGYELIHTR